MALESSTGLRSSTTPKLRSSSLIVLSAGAALVALIGYLYMKKKQLERRPSQPSRGPKQQSTNELKPEHIEDKSKTTDELQQPDLEKISHDLVRIVLNCATKKLADLPPSARTNESTRTSTTKSDLELEEAHELSLQSISLLESETATSSDNSLMESPKSSSYRNEQYQNVPDNKNVSAQPTETSNLIKSSSTTSTASSSSSAAISTSNQAVPASTKNNQKNPSRNVSQKPLTQQNTSATKSISKNPEIKSKPNNSKSNIETTKSLMSTDESHEDIIVYEFNFPRKFCGKLIGKNGIHVDYIRSKTRTQIAVRDDPEKHEQQIVCVSGRLEDVDQALDIISSRFPLKQYPNVSFKPISKPIVYRRLSTNTENKRSLPFENSCVKKVLVAPNMFVDIKPAANESLTVHVSAVVNASHVFVQLPNNSTYESLQKLDEHMLEVYGGSLGNKEVPAMSEPVEYGSICVAPTSYGWHRAMVTEYLSVEEAQQQIPDYNEECGLATVKFLDYGGYLTIPANQLRQLRSDFMLLPFQAVECYLDGIYVYQGTEEEGKKFLTEIIKGAQLKISLCGYAEDGIPLIKLFLTNDIYQNVNLNSELVNYSYAFHIEASNQTNNDEQTMNQHGTNESILTKAIEA